MSLNREETLRRLQAMQQELDALDSLHRQKKTLLQNKNSVAVDRTGYDTGNAQRVRQERENARTEALGRLKQKNPWGVLALLLGIGLGIVFFLCVSMLCSPIPVAVGIVLCCVFKSISKRKYQAAYEAALKQLDDTYEPMLAAAEAADKQAEADYQKAVRDAKARKLAEITPQVEALEAEIRQHENALEEVRVLADEDIAEDPEIIGKMIRLISGYRADNVKECFQVLDAEKERRRREEKERLRREAERLRFEEEQRRLEEERKRHMPGEVYVYVGEKRSSGYKPPKNEIIIDGQEYGPGGIPYKKITLQPGWHTISVVVQLYYGGEYHLHQSDTLQFELPGDGKKYFQFYLKDSVIVYGFERSTEEALWQNP